MRAHAKTFDFFAGIPTQSSNMTSIHLFPVALLILSITIMVTATVEKTNDNPRGSQIGFGVFCVRMPHHQQS
jgi:hypothetical protein